MRLASFRKGDGTAGFGRVVDDHVVELRGAADLATALAEGGIESLADGDRLALSGVTLLPTIPAPAKILCIGLNYHTHVAESASAGGDRPAVFTRFADTLVGHEGALIRPGVSGQLDFEGELAIVIGRPGRAIREADALDHVAGYACFQDASVRDWQRHNSQFTPGKNFPGTGGFGPWIVTPDEAGALEHQHVVTRLNGETVQDQPISDMVFGIAQVIAYVSAFTPLAPGDVIATGTPGGVGAVRKPPLWMKPGDVVEVEIGAMGVLRNIVANER